MTCLGRTVGQPSHPALRRDVRTIRDSELATAHRRGIVGQRHAADVHRLGFRVVQLEPVGAGSRLRHPLVEHDVERAGQRDRGRVRLAGSRLAQQLPSARAHANRLVGHLKAILDRVGEKAVGIEQIHAAAVGRERNTGVEIASRLIAIKPHDDGAALFDRHANRERPVAGARGAARQAHAVE